MGRKRHTPEQIITALREAEVGLARGKSRAAVVGARGHRDALYRAGQPVGERLQRELQRQAQGRAVERGDLLLVGAGGRGRAPSFGLCTYRSVRAASPKRNRSATSWGSWGSFDTRDNAPHIRGASHNGVRE